MNDNAVPFLSSPINPQPGLPLRVAAYSRIAEAIRTNLLPPGSLLPTETELGAMMEVSRTVIREALMLLEEDGLTRTRRGVGRFVADSLPRIGIERIRPFDRLLSGTGQQLDVKRVSTVLQPASEFVAPGVGIQPGADCWMWETVLLRDGEPIAHLQEHISAHHEVTSFDPGTDDGSTLLSALLGRSASALGPGECDIGLSTVGPSRAKLLALRATDPVLVMTQYVRRGGHPFYLAKCLVAARAGHLAVIQSVQA
ncbi:GntR family transcriptional regulator [Saxibacter everestensis]|uniref:GntR family transcriptional regulator n=1 Tax=Saxibacter everestensis TaxID=2909229 RepID=A0ABY8QTP5_9MICO|nr:GntR family transcriptional regulator [Brevibacteriaceae bacterium ZFBP1038]